MKKGFTLVEVLAVIVIISLITILVMPNLLNSVNNKRQNISDSAKQMIYDATDIYVKENEDIYMNILGSTYCIKLESLVNSGKLVSPVKDLKTDKEIPLNKNIKVTIDDYNQYNYEIVEECEEIIITAMIDYKISEGYAKEKNIELVYPEGNYIKKYMIVSGTTKDNIELNKEFTSDDFNKNIIFTSNGKIEVWLELENNKKISKRLININGIDTTEPEKPVFKSKTISDYAVVEYDNVKDEESNIKSIQCKYGSSTSNLTSTTSDKTGNKCNFPLTAEYGQICITNNVDLTTCSDTKKLAVYLIKNGSPIVEFISTNSSGTEVATFSTNTTTKSLDVTISAGGSRRGIYTKNTIDLTGYSYVYSDLESTIKVSASSETSPAFGMYFYQSSDIYQKNSSYIAGYSIYSGSGITSLDNSYSRKTYVIDVTDAANKTYGPIGYYEFRRNVSSATITAKIYNVYMQLKN